MNPPATETITFEPGFRARYGWELLSTETMDDSAKICIATEIPDGRWLRFWNRLRGLVGKKPLPYRTEPVVYDLTLTPAIIVTHRADGKTVISISERVRLLWAAHIACMDRFNESWESRCPELFIKSESSNPDNTITFNS